MSVYIYEATNSQGNAQTGELQADNKQAVVDYLAKRGLIPVTILEKGVAQAKGLSFVLFEKVTTPDRILLIRNMGAGLKAGLSIIEVLDILIADASKKILRDILTWAKVNIQSGQPLSATFAFYKKYFPPMFVGMLKAGETSGQLDQNLEQLAKQLTREFNFERKIRSAMMYPMFLLFGSLGAVAVLLGVVLPKLAKVFEQSGVELPLLTRIFIAMGNAIRFNLILDAAVVVGLVWFFRYFRKTQWGEKIFGTIAFHIPVVKDMIKKSALVRFSRSLGNLLGSGISFGEALLLCAESVGSKRYQNVILKAREQVLQGTLFSTTFISYPHLFPHFLTSLIVVGEKTGTLGSILLVFADFYEDELDTTLKDFSTFIEPLLLLVMGLVIGSIAFSIMMPIYQLVGKFT